MDKPLSLREIKVEQALRSIWLEPIVHAIVTSRKCRHAPHRVLEGENWRSGHDRWSRPLSETGGPASAHMSPRAGPSLLPEAAPPCWQPLTLPLLQALPLPQFPGGGLQPGRGAHVLPGGSGARPSQGFRGQDLVGRDQPLLRLDSREERQGK